MSMVSSATSAPIVSPSVSQPASREQEFKSVLRDSEHLRQAPWLIARELQRRNFDGEEASSYVFDTNIEVPPSLKSAAEQSPPDPALAVELLSGNLREARIDPQSLNLEKVRKIGVYPGGQTVFDVIVARYADGSEEMYSVDWMLKVVRVTVREIRERLEGMENG